MPLFLPSDSSLIRQTACAPAARRFQREYNKGRLESLPLKFLPTIPATAEVALTSASAAALATRTAPAAALPAHRPRFIDYQRPPHQVFPVARRDRRLRLGIIINLDESEAACLAAESISHHIDTVHVVTGLYKEILHIRFVC
jgi:hypothetical protein